MTATIDFVAIKQRQQRMWASGGYAAIGSTLQIVGENLCEAIDVVAGSRVLDVAAGNGNASLAAARRGADVLATDYVPELVELAAARAEADGLALRTDVADVEQLPFAGGTFDAVLSTFGVMFAPDQERAAEELARVCRPGGRIGLANWTPDGFVGAMLRTVGAYVPPPAGVRSPVEWGTRERLAELFAGCAYELRVTRRDFVFRYRSADDWLETFASLYGPFVAALASLDDEKRAGLLDALRALALEWNDSARALRIPSSYLEVVITVA